MEGAYSSMYFPRWGVSKESIRKFLIGNRFHVKLRRGLVRDPQPIYPSNDLVEVIELGEFYRYPGVREGYRSDIKSNLALSQAVERTERLFRSSLKAGLHQTRSECKVKATVFRAKMRLD